MKSEKQLKGNVPTPSEMIAYAREYIRSYLDTVEEKAPEHLPPIAQQSPYSIEICLLPNRCFAMILISAKEMKVKATFRNWDEIQDAVMRGVDFFMGFYPHEMKSIADWKKRGRRDAVRDIRLMDDAALGRAAGELSVAIDEISKLAESSPSMAEKAKEQIQMLRDIENRLRRGFAPIDAIATLQELKNYKPAYEKISIEFPDRALLEKIFEGVDDLMTLKARMETLESRMFEIEMVASMRDSKGSEDEGMELLRERIGKLEGHLERVSNILHLLNTKVEKYFTKTAEAERQASLENRVGNIDKKIDNLTNAVSKIQKKQESSGSEIVKEIARLEGEIDSAVRKSKRLERHFIDLAKSVEE